RRRGAVRSSMPPLRPVGRPGGQSSSRNQGSPFLLSPYEHQPLSGATAISSLNRCVYGVPALLSTKPRTTQTPIWVARNFGKHHFRVAMMAPSKTPLCWVPIVVTRVLLSSTRQVRRLPNLGVPCVKEGVGPFLLECWLNKKIRYG